MTPLEHAGLAAAANEIEFEQFVVIQDTNNVVVWLEPTAVIAKVGRWTHSAPGLIREHAIARQLDDLGAPVATPVGVPYVDSTTSMVSTLWTKIDEVSDVETVDPASLAACLSSVHRALIDTTIELPDFRELLDLAARTLFDDNATGRLDDADRRLLRFSYGRLRDETDSMSMVLRPIHGEPHIGNFLTTPTGGFLIDFETVCRGPIEWDLASLPHGVAALFEGIDARLLESLRVLNSIRVATWCWTSPGAAMRAAGQHHLDLVRAYSERE